MRVALLLCSWILICGACKRSPAGLPEQTVRAFFATAAQGDCKAMLERLSATYRADVEKRLGCDEFIKDMQRFGLQQIVQTTVDGRNPNAHLVRTRLRGRKTEIIIRVEAENGQWKIFSL